MLGASYVAMKENELASESYRNVLQSFELSMKEFTSPWLAAFMASSHITLHHSNQTIDTLEPLMNKEYSDNEVYEKMRLLHVGHVCLERQKFVDALNHWDEAVEIASYTPTSLMKILNGVMYMQMTVAYFRLNSISNALNIMESTKQCLESNYPSTHRLFAIFDFTCAYYLIKNGRPSQTIPCLKKALENLSFSNDKDFLSIVYTLLVMDYIYIGDLNCAEEYCYEAIPYISPNDLSSLIPHLLDLILDLKRIALNGNPNYTSQYIRAAMLFSQRLLSAIVLNSITPSESIDEQTCTTDELIVFANYYRHRQDYVHAEKYYMMALDKTTEID
ncbi:unnamed protein product [Rotaria sordida]|uniref:Uncharacterized protein n=1 Tax=Rotaria sordida TaxID=392033 RepID=A0A814LHU1_9BILA|nr:unnamed protein product [Rotaria sordida]